MFMIIYRATDLNCLTTLKNVLIHVKAPNTLPIWESKARNRPKKFDVRLSTTSCKTPRDSTPQERGRTFYEVITIREQKHVIPSSRLIGETIHILCKPSKSIDIISLRDRIIAREFIFVFFCFVITTKYIIDVRFAPQQDTTHFSSLPLLLLTYLRVTFGKGARNKRTGEQDDWRRKLINRISTISI